VYTRNATNGILVYNIQTKTFKELPLGLVDIQKNCVSRVSDTKFAVIGATSTSPAGIYLVDITKPSEKVLLKSSSNIELPASVLSESKHITFPRTHGETPGSAHVIFVPPKNLDFEAPPASKPPLIVSIHGGPTSHKAPGLSLETQYFTSRGYAYCSVNYGGSTGYGRKYRESLDSKWGILDVDDAASCVSYLASEGLIDGKKVGIVGGSAGGYTVLQSLIVYPDLWAGGVSLFGVGNMKALAAMTHKFEAHYLFDLMFPQGTPEKEQEKIYWERSPCFHADKIKKPLLMLQGSEDKVVPMAQSEEMERVMKKNGADVKLVIFEGEGHGFKRRENIKRSIEEEEELWKRTLLG
jgi:dipeptidyl aminopeptidase/acylaminoacyl peptidase